MEELKRKEDQSAPSGMDNKGAKAAIDLYARARTSRRNYGYDLDNTWQRLVDFYNDSMNGADQILSSDNSFQTNESGNFQVKNKLLFYALNSIVKNMKRPSRKFRSEGDITVKTSVIKDAVDMVQADGGLYDCLTEDFNLFNRFVGLGDSFIMLGFGNDKQPVKYTIPQLTNTFIDPAANCLRNKTGIGAAGEALVIEEQSYDKAKKNFPNKLFMSGKLPMSTTWDDNFNKTEYQKYMQDNRIVEIGHYFNIDAEKPYYCILAGTSATVLAKYEGKDYPYFDLDGNPFIPLVHFKGLVTPTGLYNKGIWHLLYDYANLLKEIRNLALKHVQMNVNPVGIVNIDGTAEEFLEQWSIAREAQALGERGFIINEIRNGGNTSSGNVTELIQAPLTAEYERMLNDAVTEIKRCGIPMDEFDVPASQAVTNTLTIEAAKNKFIQDLQERNTESYKELDTLTMAMMASGVSVENQKTVITSEGKFTLGAIADALKNINIDVDVESRSGAYKTEAYQLAASNEMLQLAMGTAVEGKVKAEALRLRGLEVTDEELAPQPQSQGGIPETEQATSQAAQAQQLIEENQATI